MISTMWNRPFVPYFVFAVSTVGTLLAGSTLHALWPDWRWHQEPFHSTMEALGGLASMAMAIVLFQGREGVAATKWHAPAVGLLGMGLLEVFHAMAEPGNAFVFLRNVASLAGGIGFGLTWLQESRDGPPRKTWPFWMIPAGALGLGIWGLAAPDQVPEMIRNGELTPTAVAPQSLACVLFFAAAVRFLQDYRRLGKSEYYLFASLALLFGLAELVFMYSIPWGISWWFWHGLRLIACLLLLIHLSQGYLHMIDDLKTAFAHTKQAEETLRRNEQQLRQALDERERMAEDLHDDVIQSVFAIGLNLERCRRLIATAPQESVKQLAASIADLKTVIRDLRGYLVGLEPPISNGRELETALASLVRSMGTSNQLRYGLEVDPDAANLVAPEQAAQVLSIVREAMSNSLRHSGAQTGTVSLRLRDGGVRLVVEDDGVGFRLSTISQTGHGLRNMEARVRKLGGRLEVTSELGHGTRVVCDLPQERKHAGT